MARSADRRWRTPVLWLVGVRALLGLVAIPLAPFLYREHFIVLVLLRPTKEVLLAGGFLVRTGKVNVVIFLAAAVPLLVLGVWVMYYLGRAYATEIKACNLPRPANRLLPPERIANLQKVLRKRGPRLVFLGRLAAFPSTLIAAAAGSSKLDARRFMKADGLGALASVVEVVGAGYLLGEAYDEGGPWLTGAGIAILAVVAVLFGRYLKRA